MSGQPPITVQRIRTKLPPYAIWVQITFPMERMDIVMKAAREAGIKINALNIDPEKGTGYVTGDEGAGLEGLVKRTLGAEP